MIHKLEGLELQGWSVSKAPCAHIVYTQALKYLYRDPFKA